MLSPEQLIERRRTARLRVAEDVARREKQLGVNQPSPATRTLERERATYWIKQGVKCDLPPEHRQGFLKKIQQAVKVELSSKVLQEVYDTNMAHCHSCKHVSIRRRDEKHFCECCGCAKWTFSIELPGVNALGSDMDSKNWHSANECPMVEPRFKAVD